MSQKILKIRRPDDMHVHLRDGEILHHVARYTASRFARGVVMPNLKPPVKTGADLRDYERRIRSAAPGFTPLMTVMLGRWSTPDSLSEARDAGAVAGKLYPADVTTNSEEGVQDVRDLYDAFGAMEACGMVLCIHGEKPGSFCMSRESDFLPSLSAILASFPRLKVVLEHVTTEQAVRFVQESSSPFLYATITVHHLYHTLDDVVGGSIRPHNFCKPIPKTPLDRHALQVAAVSGDHRFFLGTDSAPHAVGTKECDSGCAGVFSAPCALEALIAIFESWDSIDRVEAFVSEFGARAYGLPLNDGHVVLSREPYLVPARCGDVVPFLAGRVLDWSLCP